jgi:lipid II:glycine glycyltransferase (peptidoglycan interpeptide bridge formation enzyme)
MAGPDAAGADSQRLEGLAKQLADLERQANDLSAALQRSASIRRLLVLVVAALLGIYLYLYFMAGREFTEKKNMDKLMNELERSATANSSPVMKQAQMLVEKTWPTVSAAMSEQLQNDMPTFMTLLGTERENLAVNLQTRMESLVKGKYEKTLDQHRAILIEQFPSIKDDRDIDAMADNFKDAFTPLVKRHYGDKIRGEFEKMYKTWDEFPVDTTKRDRDELSQELYNLLFALMQHKLSASGADTPTDKGVKEPRVSSGS